MVGVGMANDDNEQSLEDIRLRLVGADSQTKRCAAVQRLDEIGDPGCIPLLEEALATEESRRVESYIRRTLARLRADAIDVDSFADDQQGHRQLDEVSSDCPRLSLPFCVKRGFDELPTLRWTSGMKLTEQARRWFVAAICGECADYGGSTVHQVRDRLLDRDCHALCDALQKLATEPDRGWALYRELRFPCTARTPESLSRVQSGVERPAR